MAVDRIQSIISPDRVRRNHSKEMKGDVLSLENTDHLVTGMFTPHVFEGE